MSWARFGSPCTNGMPYNPINEKCGKNPCPGSQVYVVDNIETVECCGCILAKDDEPWFEGTPKEMIEHLRKHAAAGHHVRPSLLLDDNEEQ